MARGTTTRRRLSGVRRIAGAASIALAVGCGREAGPDDPAMVPADSGLAAAAETQPPGRSGRPTWDRGVSYFCEGEFRFVAQAGASEDAVRLLLPDTTLTLPHVVSASGARYEDGAYRYWSKAGEALLETPDRSYGRCVSDGGGPGWREARARGVRFRAVGQEPGWILDIQADGRVDVEADYGEAVYRFPPAEPETGAGRTLYRIETEAHRATIVIEDEPCRDVMSGWPFEATVRMDLDGREYQGCGRWL